MAHFSTEIRIAAPKKKVWDVLADIGGIYKWNPGVSHSYSTSDNNHGEGATRHCDLSQGGYLKERAVDWREGQGFKIDIFETSLPLKSNVVDFTVEGDMDGTIVTVTPEYVLKYGPLGWLLDQLWARRQFKKGMADLLAGLKYHVETGELVGDRIPDDASAT